MAAHAQRPLLHNDRGHDALPLDSARLDNYPLRQARRVRPQLGKVRHIGDHLHQRVQVRPLVGMQVKGTGRFEVRFGIGAWVR